MSQQPYPVYMSAPRRSNGLGIAGFIVSLLGIVSCGLLSPVGLVLSFVALFKSPRGFALTGVILGVIGCICGLLSLILGLFTAALGAVGIGAGVAAAAPYIETEVRMAHIADVVAAHKNADGSFSTDLASFAELDSEDRRDHWGHPLHIVTTGPNRFEIVSDGPDGITGTDDDLRNSWGDSDRPRRRHRRHVQID